MYMFLHVMKSSFLRQIRTEHHANLSDGLAKYHGMTGHNALHYMFFQAVNVWDLHLYRDPIHDVRKAAYKGITHHEGAVCITRELLFHDVTIVMMQ